MATYDDVKLGGSSALSTSNYKTDPLRNFKFVVTINHESLGKHFINMGFMSVSGFNVTTEVIPYREGGMNTTTQKMPGQSDFAPITLQKGLIVGSPMMLEWTKELFTVMQGTGTGTGNFRANMVVKVLQHPVTNRREIPVVAAYKVYNAWPTSISYSDLDAGANALIITQMTLAHEGFDAGLAEGYGKKLKQL